VTAENKLLWEEIKGTQQSVVTLERNMTKLTADSRHIMGTLEDMKALMQPTRSSATMIISTIVAVFMLCAILVTGLTAYVGMVTQEIADDVEKNSAALSIDSGKRLDYSYELGRQRAETEALLGENAKFEARLNSQETVINGLIRDIAGVQTALTGKRNKT